MPDALKPMTTGERLLIWRRRLRISQMGGARVHGVSTTLYSRWERDIVKGPRVKLEGGLMPHERALLYRRRLGWSQDLVAANLGVCKHTLRQMEMGRADPTALLCYWEQ